MLVALRAVFYHPSETGALVLGVVGESAPVINFSAACVSASAKSYAFAFIGTGPPGHARWLLAFEGALLSFRVRATHWRAIVWYRWVERCQIAVTKRSSKEASPQGVSSLTMFVGAQLVAPQEGVCVLLRASAAVATAIVGIHAATSSTRMSEYT